MRGSDNFPWCCAEMRATLPQEVPSASAVAAVAGVGAVAGSEAGSAEAETELAAAAEGVAEVIGTAGSAVAPGAVAVTGAVDVATATGSVAPAMAAEAGAGAAAVLARARANAATASSMLMMERTGARVQSVGESPLLVNCRWRRQCIARARSTPLARRILQPALPRLSPRLLVAHRRARLRPMIRPTQFRASRAHDHGQSG